MSKQGKNKIDSVFFDKFKNYWVLTSRSIVEGGRPVVETPPVRIITLEDKNQLKNTLCTILDEEVSVIPGAVFDDPTFSVDESYKFNPLGLKSMRGFYKHSRGFWLKRSEKSLELHEWKRFKGGGYCNILWSKEFPPDDIESLVKFLIEKVRSE